MNVPSRRSTSNSSIESSFELDQRIYVTNAPSNSSRVLSSTIQGNSQALNERLINIPYDIFIKIFGYLNSDTLRMVRLTSKLFKKIIDTNVPGLICVRLLPNYTRFDSTKRFVLNQDILRFAKENNLDVKISQNEHWKTDQLITYIEEQESFSCVESIKSPFILTIYELIDPDNQKNEFVHEYNKLNIGVQLQEDQNLILNIKKFIEFLNNSDNSTILNRLTMIKVGNISSQNVELIQELIDTLGSQCPNLKYFFCQNIKKDIAIIFPNELINLTHFSCGNIDKDVIIEFPNNANNLRTFFCEYIDKEFLTLLQELPNLTSLSLGDIRDNVRFCFPGGFKRLSSLSFRNIGKNVIFQFSEELSNLTTLSFGNISSNGKLIIAKCNALTTFSCGSIRLGATIEFSEDFSSLSSFSCGYIESMMPFKFSKPLPRIISFSCKDIAPEITFTFPEELCNVAYLSCGTVNYGAIVKFPKNLSNLISFSFKDLMGSFFAHSPIIFPEELETVTSFSCGDIQKNVNFKLPRFSALKSIAFGKIDDQNTKKAFENIQNLCKLINLENLLKINMAPKSFNDIGLIYSQIGDDCKALEYFKQADSIEKPQSSSVEKFESRYIILNRGKLNYRIMNLKQKIQKPVLDNIIRIIDKNGWDKTGFWGGEWGIKKYMDENYLKGQLGALANKEGNVQMAQMLCFEAMNLGIMASENKPYEIVKIFVEAYPDLVKQIALDHPEFFVDGSIVKACVQIMPDKMSKEYIVTHASYMGMNERIRAGKLSLE